MTIEGSSGKDIDPEMTFEKVRQNQHPTWADMQKIAEECYNANKNGKFEISAKIEDVNKLIHDLIDANFKYKTALKFYADENRYREGAYGSNVGNDKGYVAREALK